MEGAAAAAAAEAGLPMVMVRGGDGVVFTVQARRLVELAPEGFAWDLPAIESLDVYHIVQEYRITVRGFTDPATGGIFDMEGLAESVEAIFAAEVHDLETLGHLGRAAIDLRMIDLLTDCYTRVQEFPDQIEQQQLMQFLQNALENL